MQLTLRALDGRRLAAKSIIIFSYIFCNAEFDRSAQAGIGENRKLSGDNKRTTPTPEVERPVYATVAAPAASISPDSSAPSFTSNEEVDLFVIDQASA